MKYGKIILLLFASVLMFSVASAETVQEIVVTDADSVWNSDLITASTDVLDSTDAAPDNLITWAFVSHADSVWMPTLTAASSDVLNSTDAPEQNLIKYAFVSHADSVWRVELENLEALKNQPPIASFTFSNNSPGAKEEIFIDASGSVDLDGEIAYYHWKCTDSKNDVVFTGYTENPEIFYYWEKKGNYSVELEVADDNGATSTIVKNIEVTKGPWKIPWWSRKKVSEKEIKKIQLGLGIPEYCGPCPIFEYFFFNNLKEMGAILEKRILNKAILNKEMVSQGKDITFKTYIMNTIQDMELVDDIAGRSFKQDEEIEAFFENMADVNNWATMAGLTSDVIIGIGEAIMRWSIVIKGSGVGIVGPLLMIPNIYKAGVGLQFLDKAFYRRALWFYFWERYFNESSSNQAWALITSGIITFPRKYHITKIKEYFNKLYEEYSPYISQDGGLDIRFKESLKGDLRKILFAVYESYQFEPLHKEVKLKK